MRRNAISAPMAPGRAGHHPDAPRWRRIAPAGTVHSPMHLVLGCGVRSQNVQVASRPSIPNQSHLPARFVSQALPARSPPATFSAAQRGGRWPAALNRLMSPPGRPPCAA